VECVAGNIKPSGCTTEYDIIFITSLNTGNRLPSVDDLRASDAGDSEF
jgi:predicted RNA-binding protein with EMAP domain